MKQKITEQIKESLKQFFWVDEDGKLKVSLGNCRLDFRKDYYFEKFTTKGVKLYNLIGGKKVFLIGAVEFREEYGDFAFYTESWNYIEHFKLQGGKK